MNVYLRGQGTKMAAAGILLNYFAEDNFMAFTIDANGAVSVIVYSDGKFDKQDSEDTRAKLDGTDILSVRETKDMVYFTINGEEAFTMDQDNSANFNLTYGIIAFGAGRFAFDGLNIAQTGGGSTFPAPGGGTTQTPFPAPGGTGSTTPTAPTTPAPTQQTTQASEADIYVGKVIVGTTLGIFFHEFGHALIGETGLPATGPEEDTADGFSAFLLGAMANNGSGNTQLNDMMEGMAEYASLMWYHMGLGSAESDLASAPAWLDEHAPGLKRFRNSFCILYGTNPDKYEDIAAQVGFTNDTKARCIQDFPKRSRAWDVILKTVSRNLGPDFPGDLPKNAPGGKITVRFETPKSDVGLAVKTLLGDSQVMAQMATFLEQVFVWPRNLEIVFRECEDVNAWYDGNDGSITMCYGMSEFTSKLIFQADQNGGTPTPAGQTAPAAQLTVAEQFLLGVWTATAAVDGGQAQFRVTYADDGSYLAEEQYPGILTRTVGRWAADAVKTNGGGVQIQFDPVDWEPKQICDQSNRNCQDYTPEGDNIFVEVTSENTVEVEGLKWTRVQ